MIFLRDFPWIPIRPSPLETGPGTRFPVELGIKPMHDLYWQPKNLVLNGSCHASRFDDSITIECTGIGPDRADRAIQLCLPKSSVVTSSGTGAGVAFASFEMEPSSARLSDNRRFMEMTCGGTFHMVLGSFDFEMDFGSFNDTGTQIVGQVSISLPLVGFRTFPLYGIPPEGVTVDIGFFLSWITF